VEEGHNRQTFADEVLFRVDMSGFCGGEEPVRAWAGGAGDLSLISVLIGVVSWKPDMSHARHG
jgi:hypothetical protein